MASAVIILVFVLNFLHATSANDAWDFTVEHSFDNGLTFEDRNHFRIRSLDEERHVINQPNTFSYIF